MKRIKQNKFDSDKEFYKLNRSVENVESFVDRVGLYSLSFIGLYPLLSTGLIIFDCFNFLPFMVVLFCPFIVAEVIYRLFRLSHDNIEIVGEENNRQKKIRDIKKIKKGKKMPRILRFLMYAAFIILLYKFVFNADVIIQYLVEKILPALI